MRERLERIARADGARDLDPHLPRRLRPHPAARGRAARLPLDRSRSTTRPTRSGSSRRASRSSARTRSGSRRAASTRRSRTRRTSSSRPRSTCRASRRSGTRPSRRCTSSTSGSSIASNAVDFDDMLMLTVQVLERFPEALERWQTRVPPRPRRRVPGHEPRPVPASSSSCARARERVRRWRPRPVDLRLPRRRHPQHPRLRARLRRLATRSRSSRTTARRTRSSRRRTRSSTTTATASRSGSGRSSARAIPSRSSRSRTSTPRRGSSPREIARLVESGQLGVRDRGLLPHERAVARARGRARPAGRAVPGDRRAAFLRARRDQGRRRVPGVIDNPSDAVALMRIANRPRRGIGDTSIRRLVTHAESLGIPLWDATADPEAAGVGHRELTGDPRLPHDRSIARCRPRRSSRSTSSCRRCSTAPGRSRPTRPSGRSRRADGSRTSRSSSASAQRVPRAGARSRRSQASCRRSQLQSDQDTLGGGRGAGHPDDDPQREGPRVPRRLPDRDGGGDLPALPLDRGQRGRGGAATRVRRHDARDGAADAHPCDRTRRSTAGASTTCRRGSSTSCRTAVARERLRPPRGRGTRSRRASSRRARTRALPVALDGGLRAARLARGRRRDADRAGRRSSRCDSPRTAASAA